MPEESVMQTYTADFRREDAAWVVQLRELPEVHTWAPDLPQARSHIREALALWLDVEDTDALPVCEVVHRAPGADAAVS